MAEPTVKLKAVFDSTVATQGIGKLTKSINDTNKAAKKSSSMTGALTKLQTSVGNIIKTYSAAAGAAIAVGVAVWDSVKAYSESEKVMTRLRVSVQNTGTSWNRYGAQIESVIQKQSQLSAFDDEEVASSLARLVQMTGDHTKALEINALALDVARGTGKDLTSTAVVLGKAYNGNVGALRKFGLVAKDGATSVEALGELQKKYRGQAEEYGYTMAGSADKMKVAWDNLKESFGGAAVNVLHLDSVMGVLADKMGDKKTWGELYLMSVAGPMGAAINQALVLAGIAKDTKGYEDRAASATRGHGSSLADLNRVTVDATTAQKNYLASIKAVTDAEAAQDDAELAMLQAKDAVKQAEDDLTQAVKEHGRKSREAREAQLKLNIAKREAKTAADKYKKSIKDADDAATAAAKNKALVAYLKRVRAAYSGAADQADRFADIAAKDYQNGIGTFMPDGSNSGHGPGMAIGGIIKSRPGGTTVRAAEAGSDEAFIPINNSPRSLMLLNETARRIGAVSNNNAVNINIASSNPQVSAMEAKRLLVAALS